MELQDHSTYRKLGLKAIEPEGWMKEILRRYADGLLGSLEEIWPYVDSSNAWKGGDGDSWERGPYYVDGLVPMAFLLRDQELIGKARIWIESAISSQRPDGDFGPIGNDDWWPRMVMLKAITQYADGIGDPGFYRRTEDFIDRYLDYLRENIGDRPFSMWAYVRGGEFVSSIIWMHERKHDSRYVELAKLVLSSSLDWRSFFALMPFPQPAGAYMPWEEFEKYIERFTAAYAEPMKRRRTDDPFFRIFHQTHGVNIAMGLKYLAYSYWVSGDSELLGVMRDGYRRLLDKHGQVTGIFSCDEHLNGTSPEKGTELCTVVEAMFSCEEIMRITGDLGWADLLESLAFNALPATVSGDGCSHQYDQMVNQTSCTIAPRGWYNNLDDSNIFGLEPNFGCCTANMHQGMPKFASSQWLVDGSSYICTSLFPSRCLLDGRTGLEVRIESSYPFTGNAEVHISASEPVRAGICFRIPCWAKDASCSAECTIEDGMIVLDREWKDECLTISFSMENTVVHSPFGISLRRGPLLFSLPIAKSVTVVNDRGRFSDLEYRPLSPWKYCITEKDLQDARITVSASPLMSKDGDDPPVKARVAAYEELSWKEDGDSCAEVPSHPIAGLMTEVELVPYGTTDLRITVFPELGR